MRCVARATIRRSACIPVRAGGRRAFTLIELLAVVAILTLLVSLLLPTFTQARRRAKMVKCASNLRQLGNAFHMYAFDYRGMAMPLAYFDDWPITYWYGQDNTAGVDQTRGFVWPYLGSDLREAGVYECPEQPLGTIEVLQGASPQVTSTYGYNGYYLSPPTTPGWAASIGRRPWKKLETVEQPQQVFVFADTLIDWFGKPKNCALLDPPFIYQRSSGRWQRNGSPTTAFRHLEQTNAVCADGHVGSYALWPELLTSSELLIGSVGPDNAPHYVPDWREWRD